ncbi:lens fiber membrane intrinsic protein-like [Hydractinia symbiolongicarpus]|uniref:lens fiber membrane intrinsic protein-like n=1 Tax=Hydractinia symbiolongicarpus TaxID=13093 RepID=UPI00254E47E5|nr:lens fiber membrane intrinsic protein-like [Hydractinia symbiolongicarpus]
MVKVGQVALIAIAGLSLVFIAACVGGNVWTKVEISIRGFTFKANAGLWKTCRNDECENRKIIPSWFKSVRAFAVLSCMASIGAIVMSLLGLFTEKVKSIFASVFFAAAAGCMVIALVVFVSKVESTQGGSIGWSYIIGWIGVVTSIFGVILGFIAASF